jgi:tartrate-resistant acid phosphatase type 5
MGDRRFARREVLLTGLAAAAIPRVAAAQAKPELAFLTIGDWGRRASEDQPAVAAQMAKTARAIDSEFVATVGDNFYQDGVQSSADSHWRQSFLDVYDPVALEAWYPALGNHDYHGNPDAQIAFSQVDGRWRLPARYYRQRVKTSKGAKVDLFMIDSSPIADKKWAPKSPDIAIQKAWLKSELAASDAQWKLVFGHHTVVSSGESGRLYPEFAQWLTPLLKQYGVQAYVCGHDHHLEHLVHDGMTYIISGGGSQGDGLKAQKAPGHKAGWPLAGFTAFKITGDTLTVDFIGKTGATLGSATTKNALVPA